MAILLLEGPKRRTGRGEEEEGEEGEEEEEEEEKEEGVKYL